MTNRPSVGSASGLAPQAEGEEGKEIHERIQELLDDSAPIKYKAFARNNYQRSNPNKQREQRLRQFLKSWRAEAISNHEAEFTVGVIDLAWRVWVALREQFEARRLALEVPSACPGSRDNFMYTWSNAEHYFECEIFGSGEVEFFYRNRRTEKVYGEDTTLEDGFSSDTIEKLALFSK
ncbi:hypothetical protein ACQ4M4_12675 [Leptolyngbya sp. AN02str]|uniref:hypothetical protein n=1 Tax=Leptolyngbya sp. AN02str TaxID=3423363 RepID=UPI003D3179EA